MRTSIVLMVAAAGGVHGYAMPPIKDISARRTFSASSAVSANLNFRRAGTVSSPPLRMSSAPEGEAKLPPGWDQFEGKTAEYFADKYKDNQVAGFAGPVFSDVDLQLAVVEGDKDKVKGILDGGADVNEANDRGWTALMYAAKVRKADLAEMLLERGADPDMADGFGNTALHHASNYGAGPDEAPIQTMLLKRREGKAVDVKNKAGMTPLHWAAKSGHIGTASALLAAGADPNAQTLEGSSPLLEACSGGYDVKGRGSADVVRVLLDGGADPKLMDGTTGDMPAHSAAYMCVPSALQALIDAGAGDTMDLPNIKGDTPIFLAAKGGDEECVEILMKHGVDANRQFAHRKNRTALHDASRYGKVEACRALIEGGADIHIKDDDGNTPLHEAALQGRRSDDEEIAEMLVEAGADKKAVNNDGKTALDLVVEVNDPEDLDDMYLVAALRE